MSHPALFTVEQSQALRGQIPGGHTKNLFLRDKKGAFYLVVAQEDAAIALKDLHRRLGASGRFSFGSAEAMGELLGVVPGSVTPFAAINDTAGQVTVVLDRAMLGQRRAQLPSPRQHDDHLDPSRRSHRVSCRDRTRPRIEAVSGEAAGAQAGTD